MTCARILNQFGPISYHCWFIFGLIWYCFGPRNMDQLGIGTKSEVKNSDWYRPFFGIIFETLIKLEISNQWSAPSYANLYLGGWKRNLFSSMFLSFQSYIFRWFRYIDDILLLWTGTVFDLKDFLDLINRNEFNMFFTMSYDSQDMSFLDVSLKIQPDNTLCTTLYIYMLLVTTLRILRQIYRLWVSKTS